MKIKSSFIKLLFIKVFAMGLLYLAVTQFDENPFLLSAIGVFCVALLFLKQSTLSINDGNLIFNRHFFIKNKNNYREIPINEILEVRTDVPDAKLTVSMLTVLWLFLPGMRFNHISKKKLLVRTKEGFSSLDLHDFSTRNIYAFAYKLRTKIGL